MSCALGYAIERKYHNISEVGMLANIMASKLKEDVPVKAALPPFWLQHFGGSITIDEYRKHCPTNVLTQIESPMVSYSLMTSVEARPGTIVQAEPKMPKVNTTSENTSTGLYHEYFEQHNDERETKRKKTQAKGGLSNFIKK